MNQFYFDAFSIRFRQCMAVYDEKCMTQYPAKCVKEQTCTMVYRTMCEMEGYSQKCRQMPSESCVPVTKCHRIPKTQCQPIKEKECGDVKVQVPVRQMVYKCQPFEPRQEENLDACMGMMAGNDMYAPPPGSSYGQNVIIILPCTNERRCFVWVEGKIK